MSRQLGRGERQVERLPRFVVVSDDARRLDDLAGDLEHRFGRDYELLRTSSSDASELLRRSAVDGCRTALVVVDERVTCPSPWELFARAREADPETKRVLLVHRGNWSSLHPVVGAMALGQVDYHLYCPWVPLERNLYPAVSEILSAWDRWHDAHEVALRVVGNRSDVRSHDIQDKLSRAAVPFRFYERDSDEGRALLGGVGRSSPRLPVVALYTGTVLEDPTDAELIGTMGMKTRPSTSTCDVAVLGAGPAGLAAAVYASSEGLDTLVLEPEIPGGQAGTSSLIRNYLGFQRGISGEDLAARAVEQAWLFGTDFVLSQAATGLTTRGDALVVRTSDETEVSARAVVLATGMTWRRLGVPRLEALVGRGVFYGAAGAEARALTGQDVVVVGGGNSAGQAALHLARHARSVTMLVRGAALGATMSDYLVSAITAAAEIRVLVRTEVVDGAGSVGLESVTVRDRDSGTTRDLPAAALFVLIGAEPRTAWLAGTVARDDRGHVLTGPDLLRAGSAPRWPLPRSPMLLETSRPGVFAAGDVRARSVKRVAAAAGEGATAISLVHEFLASHGS